MRRRQPPLPCQWLVTDPRAGDAVWMAVLRLPRGGGILIRENSKPHARRLAALARRRGLVIAAVQSAGVAADFDHRPRRRRGKPVSRPVHSLRELTRARLAGTDLLFLSPMYPTRSHPDAKPLPRMRAAALVRLAGGPVVALGGMSAQRYRRIERLGFAGWAAIDAWIRT